MSYQIPKVFLPRLDRLSLNLKFWRRPEPIDATQVADLLAAYDLRLLGPPRPVTHAGRNQALIVYTSAGKKILRQYRPSLGLSTIVQEHAVLKHLTQQNFLVPQLVAQPQGETLLQQDGERYALFDFIEDGFQYYNYLLLPRQSRQFVHVSGQLLGRLHRALSGFMPPATNPDGFQSMTADRKRNLDWILKRLDRCVAFTMHLDDPHSQIDEAHRLLTEAGNLATGLRQLQDILTEAQLPRSIIHADYGPYNLLFRRSEPPVILDFEMARLDWRIIDIIGAWSRFCYNKFGFRLEKMHTFLAAYQSEMSLSHSELAQIPNAWAYSYMWQTILNWYQYCHHNQSHSLSQANIYWQRVLWLRENEDKLASVIG